MVLGRKHDGHTGSTDGEVSFSSEPVKVVLTFPPGLDIGDDTLAFINPACAAPTSDADCWQWNAEAMAFRPQTESAYIDNVPGAAWEPANSQWQIHPGMVVRFRGPVSAKKMKKGSGVVSWWHAESERWVVVMADGEEKRCAWQTLEVLMANTLIPIPTASPLLHPVCWPWQHAGLDAHNWWCGGKTARAREKQRLPKQRASSQPRHGSSCNVSVSTSAHGLKSLPRGDDETEQALPEGSLPSTRTSVIMKNIPNDLTRGMLTELLDVEGFAGSYDLVYLPIDFQTEAALGYAFINLFTQDEAERLRKHFECFTAWPLISEKVCGMSWSDLDGLGAHVDRYRNSPVQHESVPDKFKPALFNKDGNRVEFPAPTRNIRPPRSKRLGRGRASWYRI